MCGFSHLSMDSKCMPSQTISEVGMRPATYLLIHNVVKPVYKDHSRNQVVVASIDRWSLCTVQVLQHCFE